MKQIKIDDEKFDNNIELSFKLEHYINTKTHIVEFPDRIHTIKFADKLNIKNNSNKKDDDDIFAEEKTIDYKPLLEQDIKEEESNGKKIYHHIMKNLVLFKNTSLTNLLKLINSICQCDIINSIS